MRTHLASAVTYQYLPRGAASVLFADHKGLRDVVSILATSPLTVVKWHKRITKALGKLRSKRNDLAWCG